MLKIFSDLILLSDRKPTAFEKINYGLRVLATCAPLAYLLEIINAWFTNNKDFAAGVFFVFVINMLVGLRYHTKMKTFSWEDFFKKNSLMIFVLIVVYILLEIVRSRIGENIGAEVFKIVIQVTTLLWPISKSCKNIFILTNGQYPPQFIMDKLYNFEKTGDLAIFNKTNNNESL